MSTDPTQKHVFTGVFIPAKIWLHPDFTPIEKMMLAEIKALGEETGWCYAGNAHFAKWLQCSPQNISIYVSSFKKQGFIDVKFSDEKTHSGRKMRVNLAWYHSIPNPLSPAVPPLSPAVPPLSPAVTDIHSKETLKDEIINNENAQDEKQKKSTHTITVFAPPTVEEVDLGECLPGAAETGLINNEKELQRLTSDYRVKEVFSMSRKIPSAKFDEYVKAFWLEVVGREKIYFNVPTFRDHFFSFSAARWRGEQAEKKRQYEPKNGFAQPETKYTPPPASEKIPAYTP